MHQQAPESHELIPEQNWGETHQDSTHRKQEFGWDGWDKTAGEVLTNHNGEHGGTKFDKGSLPEGSSW